MKKSKIIVPEYNLAAQTDKSPNIDLETEEDY